METPDHHLTIKAGLSQAFINKSLRPGYTQSAFGNSFIQRDVALRVFVDHVLGGKANIPHCFTGNSRTNDTFASTEIVAFDLELPSEGDIGVALAAANPFAAKHAFLIHATGSSGIVTEKNPHGYLRCRVYCRCERVEGLGRARIVFKAAAVASMLPGVDPSSFKPAQPYYGSTNSIEAPYINLDAEPIKLSDVAVYLADEARQEMERDLAPKLPRLRVTGTRAEAYARVAFNNELERLAAAPAGDRNRTLHSVSLKLFSYALGGWAGITEAAVQCELEQIVRRWENGNLSYKSLSTIKRGRAQAKAKILELPAQPLRIVRKVSDPSQQVSDYPNHKQRPLTLRQAGRMMVCCPEYVLIELHALEQGWADDFTVQMLADSMGCSVDTAQRMIARAAQWRAISERSAEKRTIELTPSIRMNSAERQFLRGAAKARRYRLTPQLAELELSRRLPDRVQELMEWGEPDTIRKDEALRAGRSEEDSANLEQITRTIAQSVEAFEVSADAERAAVRKARELDWMAESDETAFTPNRLPESLADLRVLLLEALIETDPDANWTHGVLMWVAGVKRNSIGALIKKSRFAPAASPTFVQVPIEGNNLHSAVKAKCVEKRGAPVAWLDGNGAVIASFSRTIPAGTKGVLLNIGKKYLRREPAPPAAAVIEAEEVQALQPEPTPAELAEREQERTEKRARREMLPRLRGCMKARGWKFVPGPFGYWERGKEQRENTWEGMVDALLDEQSWALDQLEQQRYEDDSLLSFAQSLGAFVKELA